MKKFLVIALVVIALSSAAVFLLIINTPKSVRAPATPEAISGNLETSIPTTVRPVAPVNTATPKPTPQIIEVSNRESQPVLVQAEKKLAPMTIYRSTTVEADPIPEEDVGDIAPIYRYVRCRLSNTVDSDSESPPIDGQVTDDLVYRGKVIIKRCSEVHGRALVDKDRERILGPGVWTFVLAEPDGITGLRELSVKGEVMDRLDDPEFAALVAGGKTIDTIHKTWSITDGSQGLRGVVIRTNNGDIINAFVASFIGGLAGTVTQFSTVVAPEQGGASVNLPSYVAAPAAQGIASTMNTYAQHVMDSIEKDGFFIRVPAGKLFYVRVTEDILTGRATIGGSKRIKQLQNEYLDDRELNEKVTEQRKARDDKKNNPVPAIDPALTKRLDETSAALQRRGEELQNESQQLQQPEPPTKTP